MSSSAPRSTKPSLFTGIVSTVKPPRSSRDRAAAKTHLCSMALTKMRRRCGNVRRAKPSRARLFASVAPEVKMTSSGSAPISAATEDAAPSTACAERQPTT